ncbi:hypothetical protein [Acetobacter sicerae]|uniref:hypothetical protein n=1 Tax=Acetobacter sicerae TaxID=85325 RepID=UPI00156B9BE1|nr:hypothetical protein [Acetobacter sicerae]NHN93525.1 hypothetical protein [Acetobacter sicerae]
MSDLSVAPLADTVCGEPIEDALVLVFQGTASQLPVHVQEKARREFMVSVSVAPDDLFHDVRDRLLDDVVRAVGGLECDDRTAASLRRRFLPAVLKALPGQSCALVEDDAPVSPLNAVPVQITDDPVGEGEQAGWWRVVDGSGQHTLSQPVPTRPLAQHLADGVNAADPSQEWYRYWFLLR